MIPYMGQITCPLYLFLESRFARGICLIDLETWPNMSCISCISLLSGDVIWFIKMTNHWVSLNSHDIYIHKHIHIHTHTHTYTYKHIYRERESSNKILDVCVRSGYQIHFSKMVFCPLRQNKEVVSLLLLGPRLACTSWIGMCFMCLPNDTHSSCTWRTLNKDIAITIASVSAVLTGTLMCPVSLKLRTWRSNLVSAFYWLLGAKSFLPVVYCLECQLREYKPSNLIAMIRYLSLGK